MIAIAGRANRRRKVRARRNHVSLGCRLRASCQRASLDGQLAAGADPSTSPALELRAARITTADFRGAVAVGLTRVLEAAEEAPVTLSSSAPLRRAEVLASRGALLGLAFELRTERAVRARGVALAQRLLTDVHGPLYTATRADDVEQAAWAARVALCL